MNHTRLVRLYREERLMVRRRGGASGLWARGRRCRSRSSGHCRPSMKLIGDEVERRAYFADRFSAGWHTTLMIRH